MQFAQHAIFRFDMSQLNLNNFWMDKATELRLDSKDAFFMLYPNMLSVHLDIFYMLIFRREPQIRLFFFT